MIRNHKRLPEGICLPFRRTMWFLLLRDYPVRSGYNMQVRFHTLSHGKYMLSKVPDLLFLPSFLFRYIRRTILLYRSGNRCQMKDQQCKQFRQWVWQYHYQPCGQKRHMLTRSLVPTAVSDPMHVYCRLITGKPE